MDIESRGDEKLGGSRTLVYMKNVVNIMETQCKHMCDVP